MSSKTVSFVKSAWNYWVVGFQPHPIEKTSKLVKSDHFTPRNLWIHQTCSSTFVWNTCSWLDSRQDKLWLSTTHQWFSNLNYPHLWGLDNLTEGFGSLRFWTWICLGYTFCKAEGRGRSWRLDIVNRSLSTNYKIMIPCTQATRNVKHHNYIVTK